MGEDELDGLLDDMELSLEVRHLVSEARLYQRISAVDVLVFCGVSPLVY